MSDPTRTADDAQLRERAVKRLKARAGFWTHLVIYLAVNAFLVVVWTLTGADFFWPVFPMVGWGIAVVMNAWGAFGPDPVTEERIRREIDRMQR
jgi:hypothetical protein